MKLLWLFLIQNIILLDNYFLNCDLKLNRNYFIFRQILKKFDKNFPNVLSKNINLKKIPLINYKKYKNCKEIKNDIKKELIILDKYNKCFNYDLYYQLILKENNVIENLKLNKFYNKLKFEIILNLNNQMNDMNLITKKLNLLIKNVDLLKYKVSKKKFKLNNYLSFILEMQDIRKLLLNSKNLKITYIKFSNNLKFKILNLKKENDSNYAYLIILNFIFLLILII